MEQTLEKRNTYIPTDVSQVRSNCDTVFKQSFNSRDSEHDLKTFIIKQVCKQNRKLYKGIINNIRNLADRYIYGFQRFDKVKYKDKECFVFGRRLTGYFDIRTLNGEKISSSIKYIKIKLLERFKILLIERKKDTFLFCVD